MKKMLMAVAATALLPTSLLAADLPSRRAPPVYVAPVPVFSWTGFYAGVNAGYAFDGNRTDTLIPNDPLAIAGEAGGFVAPFIRTHTSGFTGGGQIGYNYQFGSGFGFGGGGVVVGLEADAAYTDLHGTTLLFGNAGDSTVLSSRIQYIGTVRGRLGYAFDQFLVYGTGGFAYGGVSSSTTVNVPPAIAYNSSSSTMRTGYAYGGGVEYALPTSTFLNLFKSSAVTLKAEFIHYDLGTNRYLVPGVSGAFLGSSYTSTIKTTGNLARVGINYKFDFNPTPVVARY